MILSHEHRFIYIKTHKTASTSIETFLSRFCGPDDVLTPTRPDLEAKRHATPRNYRIDHPAKPQRAWHKRLFGRPERYYHPSVGYYEHMPAWRVRTYCGEDVWNSYFKFSFDRNPWDRQVSWYYYRIRNRRFKPSFAMTLKNKKRWLVPNAQLYTIDRVMALDFVGRYEAIDADFRYVLDRIGLKTDERLPFTNLSPAAEAERDYRSHYTDQTRATIADWYPFEIAHFGYAF